MAAPNIVNVSSIIGKTALVNLADDSATTVLQNTSSSGKVLKLGGVLATNTEGVNINVAFSLYITRSSTDYFLTKNVTIPAQASYEAFLKDSTPIYLEEGDVLVAQSGNSSGYITVAVAYEEIT